MKWFIPEPGQVAAMTLFSNDRALVAPDIVLAETMHALRRKVRAGEASDDLYMRAANDLPRYFDNLFPTATVIAEAAKLSRVLDHGFYDCIYVALAQSLRADFASADERFLAKVRTATLPIGLHDFSRRP